MRIVGNCIVHYESPKRKVIVVAESFDILFNHMGVVKLSAKALAAQHNAKAIEYWAGGRLIAESQAAAPSGSGTGPDEN